MKNGVIIFLSVLVVFLFASRACEAPGNEDEIKAELDRLEQEYIQMALSYEQLKKDTAVFMAEAKMLRQRIKEREQREAQIHQAYQSKIREFQNRTIDVYDSLTQAYTGSTIARMEPKHWSMLYTKIFQGEEALELLPVKEQKIEFLEGLVVAKDGIIKSQNDMLDIKDQQIANKNQEIYLINEARKSDKKKAKKQGRKEGAIAGIITTILIALGFSAL